MIICFECAKDTKEQLDKLMSAGSYRDYSEVIAVALANQLLLHVRSKDHLAVVLDDSRKTDKPTRMGAAVAIPRDGRKPPPAPRVESARDDLSSYGIPEIFRTHPMSLTGPIAEPSDNTMDNRPILSQESWIFGQYNKLLPAKASCRALSNFLTSDKGMELQQVAKQIAAEARNLGAHLLMLDRRFHRDRDDMHSTAFPGPGDPDKGRIRYASQFVGAFNKNGQISGLLVDLKLINRLSHRDTRISLTNTGWKFGLMDSPVLDNDSEVDQEKFSDEERALLLDHIASNVPREHSAYIAMLSAITEGADTPDKLRAALETTEQDASKIRPAFLSTQRSGAISRMNDLSLLYRDRDGVRVKYIITDEGRAYLQQKNTR